jgi:AcrR family transcriptional regulator
LYAEFSPASTSLILAIASRIPDRTILDAVIATVLEHGYAGATTRQIAETAGVNEVTLFRRFGDKRRLMLAAVDADIGEFAAAGTTPTDDVNADLRGILQYYATVMDGHGRLILILITEAGRDPDLAHVLRAPMAVQAKLRALIAHHQRAGHLIREPPADALQALIGPLFARMITAQFEPESARTSISVDRLLDRFLAGHGARGQAGR